MRTLLVFFISFYQKRISPHKGFSCAHKVLHKGHSCSEYTKQQIIHKGLFASLKNIKQRFKECGDSAFTLRQKSLKHQRGECDLGLSSCIGCESACVGPDFDYFDVCSEVLDFVLNNIKKVLLALILVSLLLIIGYYYYIGRQIDTINIRLKSDVEETMNGSVSKLFKAQLPDYRIHFVVGSHTKKSYTLRNISAKNWISIKPQGSLYLSDIAEMTIVNKQLTKDIKLETFISPKKSGQGDKFEYVIKREWNFF